MIKTREQVGMADGKPVVKLGDGYLLAIEADFAEPVKFLLQLISAHDGSATEALSRAIVARANEIGLQVLALPQPQISPKGEKQ